MSAEAALAVPPTEENEATPAELAELSSVTFVRNSRITELVRIVSAFLLIAGACNISFSALLLSFFEPRFYGESSYYELVAEVGQLLLIVALLTSSLALLLLNSRPVLFIGVLPLLSIGAAVLLLPLDGLVWGAVLLLLAAAVRELWKVGFFSPRIPEVVASPLVGTDHPLLLPGVVVQAELQILSGVVVARETTVSWLRTLVVKGRGERLSRGSEILRGRAEVRVIPEEAPRWEFHAANLAKLVDSFTATSPTMRTLLFGFFLVGAVVVLAHHDFGASLGLALFGGAMFLLAGCAGWGALLRTLVPAVVVRRAFERGILFHSTKALAEALRSRSWHTMGVAAAEDLTLSELRILDDGVSREQLTALLFTATAHDESPVARSISRWCREGGGIVPEQCLLETVSDYRSYTELQALMCTVRGVEISIGPEEFLIQRGIHLPLHLTLNGSDQLLVALGDQLVAALTLQPKGEALQDPQLAERGATAHAVSDRDVVVALFDPVLCEYRGEGVTLLDCNMAEFQDFLSSARRYARGVEVATFVLIVMGVWSVALPFALPGEPLLTVLGTAVALGAAALALHSGGGGEPSSFDIAPDTRPNES